MAVIRSTSSQKRVGRVGSDSYYVRDGKQVVRQALNNSNYGESASRTEAQQRRRVRWANLVNVYKSMKSWQPKAYESKKQGQTDYNIFMSVNINTATAALTKDMALNGCAVMEAFQVSRGSLPTIQLSAGSVAGDAVSDIVITQAITSGMTIGQLSQMIIENNPVFQNGDNIALPVWAQMVDGISYPYLLCRYQELTLDVNSAVPVGETEFYRFISSGASDYLTIRVPGSSFGQYIAVALIHTRKSGQLLTSSQSAFMLSSEYLNQFNSDAFVQTAIDSYGLDSSVPLDPGEGDDGEIYPTEWETVTTQTLDGNGEEVVRSESVALSQGTYRIIVTPSSWSYPSSLIGTQLLLLAELVPTEGGATIDEIIQYYVATAELGESVRPTVFKVSTSNTSLSIALRASAGSSVGFIIQRAK